MTDYFALLDEPRRPWIDPEHLKAKFLALSTVQHPDRVHGSSEAEKAAAQTRFAELNAAYQCLRQSKERLRHLLELELNRKPREVQSVSSAGATQFFEISQLCREVDLFLVEKEKAMSPLWKARLFAQGIEWLEKLRQWQSKIEGQREELIAEMRKLNARWESAPRAGESARADALPLERLEEIYHQLSFVARWTGLLQERILKLSL